MFKCATRCGCWGCPACREHLRRYWVKRCRQIIDHIAVVTYSVCGEEQQFTALIRRLHKYNLAYCRVRLGEGESHVFHQPLTATQRHKPDPSSWLTTQEAADLVEALLASDTVRRVSTSRAWAAPIDVVESPDADKTGVYGIRQLSTGRIYVGSTRCSFQKRWNGHVLSLTKNNHPACSQKRNGTRRAWRCP